jgi:hypothetical protein
MGLQFTLPHKERHSSNGSDPITPESIGAATAEQGAKADSAVQPVSGGIEAEFFVATGRHNAELNNTSAGEVFMQPDPRDFRGVSLRAGPLTDDRLIITPDADGFMAITTHPDGRTQQLWFTGITNPPNSLGKIGDWYFQRTGTSVIVYEKNSQNEWDTMETLATSTQIGLVSTSVGDKVAKAGDTMTGKLNLPASSSESAGLNIGVGSAPSSSLIGDLWGTTAGLFYKVSATIIRALAIQNGQNVFSRNQVIDVSETFPALRVTQRGEGEALRVEDDTTPDSTSFVVSNQGRVGIGAAPDATAALAVDSGGIKFGDATVQTTAGLTGDNFGETASFAFTGSGNPYQLPDKMDQRLVVSSGVVGSQGPTIRLPENPKKGARVTIVLGTFNPFNTVTIVGFFTVSNNNPSGTITGNVYHFIYNGSFWQNITDDFAAKPNWMAPSGARNEILNKPTIPAAQVNSDWNATSGVAQILNKPTIPAAQVNADWNSTSGLSEVLNKPLIPILLGHGAFSYAAGGNTRYFAQTFDLSATTTQAERNFRVPQNCVIKAAIFSSYNGGANIPDGHSGGILRLRNKTTSTNQDILTFNLNGISTGTLGTFTATGLSLTINAGDDYVIEQESGTFTTAPSSVRQMLTLYY